MFSMWVTRSNLNLSMPAQAMRFCCTISGKIGKEIFAEAYRTGDDPAEIVERRGVQQISDEPVLWAIIDRIVGVNAKQAEAYLAGKDGLFGFFVGQVMKETKGQADPRAVNDLVRAKLAG